MLNEPRIVIIGAGAAGISAACRLFERGLRNITILEAKNRIGGRIFTTDFADNVVDLGAQWVHGEADNIVYNLAKSHKLLESSHNLNDTNRHVFVDATGEILPQDESSKIWALYYAISDAGEEELKQQDGSYGDFFINKFNKYYKQNHFTSEKRASEILEWMGKFDNSLQCSDSWFDVSAKGLAEYKHCDGDLLLNWKDRGYKTLLDIIMHKYPDNSKALPITEKIRFSTEVQKIDYLNPNEIIITTNTGENYKADNVIFTASLGVLKQQYSSLFTPPLPSWKELAIKGLNIGTVDKIFLEFPYQWWPKETADFEFLWPKEEKKKFLENTPKQDHWLLEIFGFFTVDFQPRILCGWVTGQGANYMETLSASEVKEKIYSLLKKFLGKKFNIPWPDNLLRSKWHTDQHFRGSYSCRSLTSERTNVWASDLADPIVAGHKKPTILFAGEATHSHYYSTVHGAVVTGFREADRLAEYYRQVDRSSDGSINNEPKKIGEINVERTRIAIVGAGIAGLAAAKTLEDHQFHDYILLEAQDYVGGRIKSIPWNDNWIEEGAQFLHGSGSELAKLCTNNSLISKKESAEGHGIYVRNDGVQVDKHLIQEIDNLIKDILDDCEKYIDYNEEHEIPESVGSLLQLEIARNISSKEHVSVRKLKEQVVDWNVRFLIIDNACFKLEELSAKLWGQFRFVGGPENLVFKNGYSSAIDIIFESLKKGNVRLNSPVKKIQWNRKTSEALAPVILTLNDRKILADCVLVTSSLGFLKKHHEDLFEPSLPSNLILAIESLGFGLINKVFLDFGEPWWQPGVEGFQLIWDENNEPTDTKLAAWTKHLTGFDVLQDHEAVLLGWVGGKGAKMVESLSEEEVSNDCILLLRDFLKRETLPAPKRCKRSQWGKNEWVRGSYSHISTKCDGNCVTPKSLARPVWGEVHRTGQLKSVPTIMLAGEATHEYFYSTTHGAFDSGRMQALNFLRHHVWQ